MDSTPSFNVAEVKEETDRDVTSTDRRVFAAPTPGRGVASRSADDPGTNATSTPNLSETISSGDVPQDFHLDFWWEDTGVPESTCIPASYFTDRSVWWSEEIGQMVFQCQHVDETGRISDEAKRLILVDIAKRYVELEAMMHPEVSFEKDLVTISALSHRLLKVFWLQPPRINGVSLSVYSRGMPWRGASLYIAEGLPSMPPSMLYSKLEHSDAFRSFEPYMVLARLYEIDDYDDGPMFSGEIMVVGRERCYGGDDHPTCLGKELIKQETTADNIDRFPPLIRRLSVV
ncbi:hypothetical protein sr13416 [Sporisorium reilianum SRZ2]|uniref:Uncharacterized protein n=1 Tax=Sporisorium reilianum (strain SRZ2) TaxID=999809 RepID=E6ZZX0_SPORE|nr:hypothetical protein sr13416 [Sporisorium reilianum SRZ2]